MPTPKLHTERDPDFIYVTYIATTPDKLWAALTDGESERPFWAGTRQECTFEKGAPMVWRRNGKVDLRGEILESEPPRRLVYTFHVEGPGPVHDEGPSIVEYKIEPAGASTRLTVIHSNFKKNSQSRKGVENGWPGILSSLKTMLEGGAPLRYE
jgi:uncharacterized protein YndB with AHSA1/START domain